MTLICFTAVEWEGRVVVPARMVSELARSLAEGELTLEGGTLEVAVEGHGLGWATEKRGLEVADDFVAHFNATLSRPRVPGGSGCASTSRWSRR